MSEAGGFEVAEKLGDVGVRRFSDRFKFEDDDPLDNQIHHLFDEFGSVFIVDLDSWLDVNLQAGLAAAVNQSSLVNFFAKPRTEIAIEPKGRFSYHITNLIHLRVWQDQS